MEKMQTIYSANPALGDVKQVEQSLQLNHTKLETLNAELQKVQVILTGNTGYCDAIVVSHP